MRSILALWMGVLVGCGAPDEQVRWALDPIYAEPTESGLHAFQTWHFYSDRWSRSFDEQFYVCSLVVEVFGTRTEDEACPGCEQVWETDAFLLETDCPPANVEGVETYVSLEKLGIGPVDATLLVDDPYPGVSFGGWAKFGESWEAHGWAYPSEADVAGPTAGWDGTSQVTFWPALAWDVGSL